MNLCYSGVTIKKVERQATNWEKIFAVHITDKRVVFRMYKALLKISKKMTKRQKTWIGILSKKKYKRPTKKKTGKDA